MKNKLLLLLLLFVGANVSAQFTSIPDPKFEAKLIALKMDDVADGKILTSNISNVKQLNVYNSDISDLTGIQDFVSLTSLRCDANNLTSLNVSKNIFLTNLECSNNKITSLDISANTALTTLSVWRNNLTTLDISKNTLLTSLDFNINQITSLNTSTNIALRGLSGIQNKLTSLDLSKNTALTYLNCSSNSLTKLNLKNGKNTLFTTMYFSYNKDLACFIVDDVAYAKANWDNQEEVYALFSPYDCSIVTPIPDALFEDKLIALGIDTDGKNGIVLNSSINTIKTLDVSNSLLKDATGLEGFTALTTLNCSNNQLKTINLSKATAFANLNCAANTDLTCIQVADIATTASWTVTKDATASFSLDCNTYTSIPDAKFEAELITLKLDDIADGKVLTSKINKVKTLYLNNLDIEDLTGIQDFTALTYLDCSWNKLTNLDVSKNIALTSLDCRANQLTSIDVSKNILLTNLDCSSNQITTLDTSKNTALSWLTVRGNKFTTLDLSKNIVLYSLDCSVNKLSALDLSKNVKLYRLDCGNNKITQLDLSKNPDLRQLYFKVNLLTSINLKNGKNSLMGELDFSKNLALTCISVDDVAAATTKWGSSILTTTFFTTGDCSTLTPIPNPLFEDKLIAMGIDTDGKNGFVTNASINTITILNLSNSALTDVTGLNGFTALKTLNVSNNLITSLDLSKNIALTTLNTSSNTGLTCIRVFDVAATKNWSVIKDAATSFNLDCRAYTLIPDANFENYLISISLDEIADGKVLTSSINTISELYISNSQISSLTGIEGFVALESLNCRFNQLTTLDLSKNLKLKTLNCAYNQLTSINLGQNVLLEEILINDNYLTALNVNANIALKKIDCGYNALTSLDTSKNTLLETLSCGNNQLTTLDVSSNKVLKSLSCYSNLFTSINIQNGNYKNMSNLALYSNPTLTCIRVDDVVYANANWSNKKDDEATYTTKDCSLITIIPDSFFEDKLIALGIDTDGKNGEVLNSSIQTLTTLNIANSQIASLSGIQGFKALTNLDCSGNKLITLDLSRNITLTNLNCSANQLDDLDIALNTALTNLDCSTNLLRSLDVSKNTVLADLNCSANKMYYIDINLNTALAKLNIVSNTFSSLDLTKNTALTHLNIASNNFISLDVTKNTALVELNYASNRIRSIDLSKNTELRVLDVSSNLITSIALDKNTKLTSATLKNNALKVLSVDANTALQFLDFSNNQIAAIDVSKNKALIQLLCATNKLLTLNVSANTALTVLNCAANQLTSLNVKNTNNNKFVAAKLHFENNPNISCIKVDDKTYSDTNWTAAKDATATYNTSCELNLSSNNFTVETKGESCVGENNGEINITAKEAFGYVASVNGQSKNFINNTLNLSGLVPGQYTVAISIPGETFEQNYNLIIAVGETITANANVSSKKVNVDITKGTAPFTVFLDGTEQFQTNDSNFNVEVEKGGVIEVATAKACEGTFSKKITTSDIGGILSAYPNPTSGNFIIEIPTDKPKVKIELYNIAGQLISGKTYILENGKALLNIENQPAGMYAAKINLESPEYIKIIKK